MKKFLLVFFLINLFLASFYLDIWINANTTSRALPIITYFENGTFKIDKYHEKTCDKAYINGHYYTDKAPLPTYFVLPFFGILKSLGFIKPGENGSLFGNHIYILGGILTASLPFAIILLLAFVNIKKLNTDVSPVFLAMLPFYASFIFLFTGTFFAHILSGVFLIGSTIYLKRENHLLSGVFAGLSFLCEFNLAVIFIVWGIQLCFKGEKASLSTGYKGYIGYKGNRGNRENRGNRGNKQNLIPLISHIPDIPIISRISPRIWGDGNLSKRIIETSYRKLKPLIFFSSGVLPSVIFILIYNYRFSGSPFTMLYRFHNFDEIHSNYGFLFPSFKSVWGLSLSWYKGLLFYSPFLILVFFLAVKTLKNRKFYSLLTHPLLLSSVVYFFFIASYFGWWGGWTQGPRLLLALAMLLTFEGVIFISNRKFSATFFWIVIAFGLLITLLSKVTIAYSVPTNVANPMIDLVIPEFFKGNFNENNILTMAFNLSPVNSFIVFVLMFVGGVIFLNQWYKKLVKV